MNCNRDDEWMSDMLNRRREKGTFRELRTVEDDGCFVDFTSNDYLGLGRSTDLRRAIDVEEARVQERSILRRGRRRRHPVLSGIAVERHKILNEGGENAECGGVTVVGSGGSRLLSGNSWYAEELEAWIAAFHKREAALLFNSGYDANLALMSCLPQPGDIVLCDDLVHNSVRMGCRMGRHRQTISFRHNDTDHLSATLGALRKNDKGAQCNVFVAVESVYSMDGDLAPLKEILDTCRVHGAFVIVDEAHGTGVFGEEGRGLTSALGLESHPALFAGMHSFGKALGAHGAAVVGSTTLRHFLVNYARPLIYSTSLPVHSLACVRCAYVAQAKAEGSRRHVLDLANTFQRVLTNKNSTDGTIPLGDKDIPRHRSPIQSVIVAGNERSLFVSESLRGIGFDVRAIRTPTVPAGTERLRITLHAYNTESEVASLARHIRRLSAPPSWASASPPRNVAHKATVKSRGNRDVSATSANSPARARL